MQSGGGEEKMNLRWISGRHQGGRRVNQTRNQQKQTAWINLPPGSDGFILNLIFDLKMRLYLPPKRLAISKL
jgi:hypothetical protein